MYLPILQALDGNQRLGELKSRSAEKGGEVYAGKIRDGLHEFLTKKQIFSKVYFNPIHLTSFYKKKFNGEEEILPVTENIAKTVLTLPLYPNMTQEEKKYLIDSIKEFFDR